jgi:outer membrane protein assembly factor BamA
MKSSFIKKLLILSLVLHPAAVGVASEEPVTEDTSVVAEKKGHWLAVPIPTSNPTLGYGLTGVVLYNRKLGKSQRDSTFGAAGFYASSNSWGAGIGARTHLNRDRLRVNGGLGYVDLNWEFFGLGNDAGSNDQSVELNQVGTFLQMETLFLVHESLFLGPKLSFLSVDTFLDDLLPPGFPDPVIDATTNSFGAHLQWDTRDNEFSTTSGQRLDLFADVYTDLLGSTFNFQNYFFDYNYFHSLRQNEHHIIAARTTSCYSTDGAPFYQQCSIGMKDAFRGYPGMRYIDQFSVTAQAEYRWEFVDRWFFAFFGGLAQVAPRPGNLSSDAILPAAGAGVRYMLKKKQRIVMRLDFAWGEGDKAVYLAVGEAF